MLIESPGSATITSHSQPWHQEEEKDRNQRVQNKQTNAQEAHRPAISFPSDVVTMPKGLKTREQRATQDSIWNPP